MTPLKGLDSIRESLAARAAAGGPEGGGVPELSLVSGEVALFHFLTDRDGVLEVRFHRVPQTTPRGLAITVERLCRQEVGETCTFCSHASEDLRRSTLRWYAWVYVYALLTPAAVPDAEKIARGPRTLNVWKLGEPAVLRKGEGNNKYIVQQLLAHSERYNTLCDRIYEWERTGVSRNDTTYMLSPLPDLAAKPSIDPPVSLEELIVKEARLSPYPVRQKSSEPTQFATSVSGSTGSQLGSAPSHATAVESGSSVSRLMDLLKGKGDNSRL